MAKAAGDYAGRRRGARHAKAGDKIKNEAIGVSDEKRRSPSKAGAAVATTPTAKRGLATDSHSSSATKPRRSKRVKVDKEVPEDDKIEAGKVGSPGRKCIKLEDEGLPPVSSSLSPPPPAMRVKAETDNDDDYDDYGDGNHTSTHKVAPKKGKAGTKPKTKATTKISAATVDAAAAADLQTKKLKSYAQFAAARQSPYPDFPHPTPSEAQLAHRILASLHGERVRPDAGKPI